MDERPTGRNLPARRRGDVDLATPKLDPEARLFYDRRAGYFLHQAAVPAGRAGQLVKAIDHATIRSLPPSGAPTSCTFCRRESAHAVGICFGDTPAVTGERTPGICGGRDWWASCRERRERGPAPLVTKVGHV